MRHCARTQTPLFFTVLTDRMWNVAWAEDSPRSVDEEKGGDSSERFQNYVTVGQRRLPTRVRLRRAGLGQAGSSLRRGTVHADVIPKTDLNSNLAHLHGVAMQSLRNLT